MAEEKSVVPNTTQAPPPKPIQDTVIPPEKVAVPTSVKIPAEDKPATEKIPST